MARVSLIAVVAVAATGMMVPTSGFAQAHDHAADQAHNHAGAVVNCTNLVSPPWTGLPEGDRQQIMSVQQSLTHLATPAAAIAAGFRPVLGNIPGMGVHYVHAGRSRTGVDINEPDHLLFAPVEGEERLVGAAYAFTDVVATTEPIPFESELATWHDHPEFAAAGETLHMLHVWFVPSSNGPFAGLNFWLPFQGAGVTPPNACWMQNESDNVKIQQVAFALAATTPGGSALELLARRFPGAAAAVAERSAERTAARNALLSALDAAAKADDHHAWVAAADAYLADLTVIERTAANRLLEGLTMAQMSTPEREAAQ